MSRNVSMDKWSENWSCYWRKASSWENESTPQTQNNVSWISSKLVFKIWFLNSRLEMWVWTSGSKIDPVTGVIRISSQHPVSDLGEWRHTCHFFRWQTMWRVTFVTFLGRMWRSRTRKFLFELVTFFVTSFPKKLTFRPRRYKKNWNGKKCDDSAGTETFFRSQIFHLFRKCEAGRPFGLRQTLDPNFLLASHFRDKWQFWDGKR